MGNSETPYHNNNVLQNSKLETPIKRLSSTYRQETTVMETNLFQSTSRREQ